MKLLYPQKPDSVKLKVVVDSFAKPCLGELSPNEAGQKGRWSFCPEVCFILTGELRQIANKLDELNETST